MKTLTLLTALLLPFMAFGQVQSVPVFPLKTGDINSFSWYDGVGTANQGHGTLLTTAPSILITPAMQSAYTAPVDISSVTSFTLNVTVTGCANSVNMAVRPQMQMLNYDTTLFPKDYVTPAIVGGLGGLVQSFTYSASGYPVVFVRFGLNDVTQTCRVKLTMSFDALQGKTTATGSQPKDTQMSLSQTSVNPIIVGGVDVAPNAGVPYVRALLLDSNGRLVLTSSGTVGALVPTSGQLTIGSDYSVGTCIGGACAQAMKVDSFGNVYTANVGGISISPPNFGALMMGQDYGIAGSTTAVPKIDSAGNQYAFTNLSAQTSSIAHEVLVLNSASTAVPTAALSGRRAIEIQNLGANPIFCNINGAAVVNKSRRVGSYSSGEGNNPWAFDCTDAACAVQCIAGTADQTTGNATIATELK